MGKKEKTLKKMVTIITDNRQNIYTIPFLCTHHYTPYLSVQAIFEW